jgi:putative ABC transport system substrate-binding protein
VNPVAELQEVEAAATVLGVKLLPLEVQAAADLEGAFDLGMREHVDAVFPLTGPVFFGNQPRVAGLAAQHGLPGMYAARGFVEAGGLMTYIPNILALFRRAAMYADKILKGANPADLPVEQPREFDFVINLKTAQALGLTIPEQVLLQATEVIQ